MGIKRKKKKKEVTSKENHFWNFGLLSKQPKMSASVQESENDGTWIRGSTAARRK